MKKENPTQLALDFNEPEKKDDIYFNSAGEPLPWEEDEAIKRGWAKKMEEIHH